MVVRFLREGDWCGFKSNLSNDRVEGENEKWGRLCWDPHSSLLEEMLLV